MPNFGAQKDSPGLAIRPKWYCTRHIFKLETEKTTSDYDSLRRLPQFIQFIDDEAEISDIEDISCDDSCGSQENDVNQQLPLFGNEEVSSSSQEQEDEPEEV